MDEQRFNALLSRMESEPEFRDSVLKQLGMSKRPYSFLPNQVESGQPTDLKEVAPPQDAFTRTIRAAGRGIEEGFSLQRPEIKPEDMPTEERVGYTLGGMVPFITGGKLAAKGIGAIPKVGRYIGLADEAMKVAKAAPSLRTIPKAIGLQALREGTSFGVSEAARELGTQIVEKEPRDFGAVLRRGGETAALMAPFGAVGGATASLPALVGATAQSGVMAGQQALQGNLNTPESFTMLALPFVMSAITKGSQFGFAFARRLKAKGVAPEEFHADNPVVRETITEMPREEWLAAMEEMSAVDRENVMRNVPGTREQWLAAMEQRASAEQELLNPVTSKTMRKPKVVSESPQGKRTVADVRGQRVMSWEKLNNYPTRTDANKALVGLDKEQGFEYGVKRYGGKYFIVRTPVETVAPEVKETPETEVARETSTVSSETMPAVDDAAIQAQLKKAKASYKQRGIVVTFDGNYDPETPSFTVLTKKVPRGEKIPGTNLTNGGTFSDPKALAENGLRDPRVSSVDVGGKLKEDEPPPEAEGGVTVPVEPPNPVRPVSAAEAKQLPDGTFKIGKFSTDKDGYLLDEKGNKVLADDANKFISENPELEQALWTSDFQGDMEILRIRRLRTTPVSASATPSSPAKEPYPKIFRGLARGGTVKNGVPDPNKWGLVFGTTDERTANKYSEFGGQEGDVISYRISPDADIANLRDPKVQRKLADKWAYEENADKSLRNQFLSELRDGSAFESTDMGELALFDPNRSVGRVLYEMGYDGATDGTHYVTFGNNKLISITSVSAAETPSSPVDRSARVPKEPWEMKQQQYVESQDERGSLWDTVSKMKHNESVVEAYAKGKKVSPEVLADYPNMDENIRSSMQKVADWKQEQKSWKPVKVGKYDGFAKKNNGYWTIRESQTGLQLNPTSWEGGRPTSLQGVANYTAKYLSERSGLTDPIDFAKKIVNAVNKNPALAAKYGTSSLSKKGKQPPKSPQGGFVRVPGREDVRRITSAPDRIISSKFTKPIQRALRKGTEKLPNWAQKAIRGEFSSIPEMKSLHDDMLQEKASAQDIANFWGKTFLGHKVKPGSGEDVALDRVIRGEWDLSSMKPDFAAKHGTTVQDIIGKMQEQTSQMAAAGLPVDQRIVSGKIRNYYGRYWKQHLGTLVAGRFFGTRSTTGISEKAAGHMKRQYTTRFRIFDSTTGKIATDPLTGEQMIYDTRAEGEAAMQAWAGRRVKWREGKIGNVISVESFKTAKELNKAIDDLRDSGRLVLETTKRNWTLLDPLTHEQAVANGLIESVYFNVPRIMKEGTELIATSRFWKSAATVKDFVSSEPRPSDVKFSDLKLSKKTTGMLERLAKNDPNVRNMLDGYVERNTAKDLEAGFGEQSPFMKWFNPAERQIRKGVTTRNPFRYLRQPVENELQAYFDDSELVLNLKQKAVSGRDYYNAIVKNEPTETYKEFVKTGLSRSDFASVELAAKDLLQEIYNVKVKDPYSDFGLVDRAKMWFDSNPVTSKIENFDQKAANFYHHEDTIYKWHSFRHKVEVLKMSPEEAASAVQKSYFDYSNAPRLVKTISKINPFTSQVLYQYGRIFGNALADKPASTLVKLAILQTAVSSFKNYAKQQLGWSEDDLDKLKEFAPEYYQMPLPVTDSDGNAMLVDMRWAMPQGDITRILPEKAEKVGDVLVGNLPMVARPVVSAALGKTPFGGDLYKLSDTGTDKARKVADQLLAGYLPPMMYSYWSNLYKNMNKGEVARVPFAEKAFVHPTIGRVQHTTLAKMKDLQKGVTGSRIRELQIEGSKIKGKYERGEITQATFEKDSADIAEKLRALGYTPPEPKKKPSLYNRITRDVHRDAGKRNTERPEIGRR